MAPSKAHGNGDKEKSSNKAPDAQVNNSSDSDSDSPIDEEAFDAALRALARFKAKDWTDKVSRRDFWILDFSLTFLSQRIRMLASVLGGCSSQNCGVDGC